MTITFAIIIDGLEILTVFVLIFLLTYVAHIDVTSMLQRSLSAYQANPSATWNGTFTATIAAKIMFIVTHYSRLRLQVLSKFIDFNFIQQRLFCVVVDVN